MGKILTFTAAQAQEIRLGILNSYRQESGTEFQPVTYLGAYEDLRTHILSKCTEVPGAEASISLHRLRKLFYYTDPNYCPNDKLEPLSFGDDFISLITRFKSPGNSIEFPLSKKANLPISKRRDYILPSAFIVIALTWFLTYRYIFRAPDFFRDDFHSNSVEDLKNRGWDFIDFDSSLFYPQDSGVLTLRSARGDYWVRPYDTPYIKNVVYRELPKECFEVTTKFTFLNNLEPWQQCGIFFLDKDKNRTHNIRVTYAFVGEKDPDKYNYIYNRAFLVIKRDHGEAFEIKHMFVTKGDSRNHSFYLKINMINNEYTFNVHVGEESNSYEKIGSIPFEFEPKYIALTAFNGYRILENGPLNNASSIPAKFDWVRVEECK